ncbi:unnamed protein product, partial [marine sediment metagenome]
TFDIYYLKYRVNLQYPTKKDGSKQSNTFLFKKLNMRPKRLDL